MKSESTKTVPIRKPPFVPSGASVSIVAPASYALPDRIEDGFAHLRKLGFTPKPGTHTLERGPLFFAGSPAQRLADLHAAFADPNTCFVAAIRGGYGSNYLLDNLDLELIRQHPKPFFAYSDMTGIQLHLLDTLSLPVFHGPMVAADFYRDNGVDVPSLEAALSGQPYSVGPSEGLRILKPGADTEPARGTLYGGCLSIIASLVGTPFEPQTEGKLLFLEDTGAKPYQIDRMLWQMRQAGKFDGVRGIIFGEMLACTSAGAPDNLLEEALLHFFADVDIPIAFGLRSGHVSRHNVTLTFGVEAELQTRPEPQLTFIEPAVSA